MSENRCVTRESEEWGRSDLNRRPTDYESDSPQGADLR